MLTDAPTLRVVAVMTYWTIRWIFRAAIWVMGALISLLWNENSKENLILCVFRGDFSTEISHILNSLTLFRVLMGLLMMISGGILMVLVAKLITKVVRWLVNAITVILPIICWIGVMMFLVVVEPAGSLWFIVVSCAPFALYVGIIATIRMARLAMKEFMSIVKSKPSFLLGAVARADRFVRSGLWPVNLVLFSRSIATKPRADISTSQTPREETTSRVRFQPMVEVLRYWPEDIIRPPSERMVRAGSSEKSTKVQWNIFQQARFSPAFNKKMLARRKRRGKKRL